MLVLTTTTSTGSGEKQKLSLAREKCQMMTSAFTMSIEATCSLAKLNV